MANGNSNGVMKALKIVGLIIPLAGIIGQGAIVVHDVKQLKDSQLQMAKQVADIHSMMADSGWQDYSAWQWQLEMDRIFAHKLDLYIGTDFSEPPAFLRNRPGYDGP